MWLKRVMGGGSATNGGKVSTHKAEDNVWDPQLSAMDVPHSVTVLLVRGPNNAERAAISKFPLMASEGPAYFELEISSVNNPATVIAVGVGPKNFNAKGQFPGWSTGSFGYHSDDGSKYYTENRSQESAPYGEAFGQGDKIGCGIMYNSIFFTKNGKCLGPAFPQLNITEIVESRAIVAVDYPNVTITANFGKTPFLADLRAISSQLAHQLELYIATLPTELLALIFSYLPIADILNAKRICKQWLSLISSPQLNDYWQAVSTKTWPAIADVRSLKLHNWYRFYETRKLAEMEYARDTNTRNSHQIENCGLLVKDPYDLLDAVHSIDDDSTEWELKCPLLWENLPNITPYDDDMHCAVCDKNVFKVRTREEFNLRVLEGSCVVPAIGEEVYHQMMGKRRAPSASEIREREKRKQQAERARAARANRSDRKNV